jgi:type I restriction enzyme R subunit
MKTDTSEKGLETIIVGELVRSGWVEGKADNYDREFAVDLLELSTFLKETQESKTAGLELNQNSPARRAFLTRLQTEITRYGVIHILRKGLTHGPSHIDLFYPTPTPGNPRSAELYRKNRFSVTRQLRYSKTGTQLALDMCLFLNGLPIATFELKNQLTKQNADYAVRQYQKDRDPREILFSFGRCIVHFALDENRIKMCTELRGEDSWFLPFDKGYNQGAGNPPNPNGLATDYLWKEILTPQGLTDILENYAQIVEEKNRKTKKIKRVQIFPRYHQLDVVRKLLADVKASGVGKTYLIQHSAGSGKSNSIAWLSHQLVGIEKDGQRVLDSIIVITDRTILDDQIQATIKQFMQVGSTVGHAERSGDLRKFIEEGKKIIISTVQKFPFILEDIGNEHRNRRFGIIIDEAHSSQGGKVSAAISKALARKNEEEEVEEEESIEDLINRIIEQKKLLKNASYFAFTATPKNKTLELFGYPCPGPEGKTRHLPFHSYSMKQAIEEGFILDVLKSFTPYESYYKLIKRIEGDPDFDTKKAQKKLRLYVEGHKAAIKQKAEVMVDHFIDSVIGTKKIGGQARAMVVCSGVGRAIEYFHAIKSYLSEIRSPYQAIVAFSGDHTYQGQEVNEAKLNGFPSSEIADKVEEDPYRILVCADKFQTGYDQPLLHTMYVDKVLSGIKAVQTLSRLNRARPKKYDVFILDFTNDVDTIKEAFGDYYQTTILSEETDPNKVHDLKNALDALQVYDPEEVDTIVRAFLKEVSREQLDPILDRCRARYLDLKEDHQVEFKGKAKAFVRTYGFLSSILPYNMPAWEKLSIFLNLLIPKLPAPKEEDLSKGILETIDMDSYRLEKKATEKIVLAHEDGALGPVPLEGAGGTREPELEPLSVIVKSFNDQFGNIRWEDRDRVIRLLTKDIPEQVSTNRAYQNAMKNSDPQNARIEHDKALQKAMNNVVKDDTELFRKFSEDQLFAKWLSDRIFQITYKAVQVV